MFWGLILKANKRYTQVLEKPFHLSQAALDHSTADDEPVQVMYSHEDRSYLLCTLQKGAVTQCMLDLNFAEGDKLCFLTKGNGIVHLTGFLIPEDPDEFGDMDLDEEEEEEDEEVADLREKLKGKIQKEKKEPKAEVKKEAAKDSKKKKPVEESEDDEDEEDSDFDDNVAAPGADEDDDESMDEEESDDDDEDDDEEDDSDDDEEAPSPPKKQQKLEPVKKEKQNGVSNGQEKKKDKQQKPQENKEKEGPAQMKKLQGGLMFQDLKVGGGAEAKPGKKIQVYYEGKLKSNNKTFDSSKSGPGFKMTLGRGEVIKGWDIGLQGMKVGGKRKLIIPPALGYGPRGNPPVIPANSTLVFDVELKNVF